MNPRNGFCLNALHDRAFDRGLMFLDEDLRVRFRKRASARGDSPGRAWLLGFEGKPIRRPTRFAPALQFLAIDREQRGEAGLA